MSNIARRIADEIEQDDRAAGERDLCVIAFQAEAHDSAGQAILNMHGWTVDVVPVEGEPFTATVGDLCYPADGGTSVQLRVWNDNGEPTDEIREFDIYDELVRLEVC